MLHETVIGTGVRHAGLLPLEMYLEAGIPLVIYLRDKGFPELVELPEQSNHAFITYGHAPRREAVSDILDRDLPHAQHSLKVIRRAHSTYAILLGDADGPRLHQAQEPRSVSL